MVGIKLNCWKMKPMLRFLNSVTSERFIVCNAEPNTEISPASHSNVPATTLNSVVLPQPEGPTIMSSSPMRASKSTLRSATVRASPSPKVLSTARVRTARLSGLLT